MSNRNTPTDSELAILEVLWEYGAQSVRFVNEKLSVDKPIGYTTTLKIMQIMHEKGLLSRDTSQRSHLYQADVKEQIVKSNLLDKFILSTFGGSAKSLVMQVLGKSSTTEEEIEEIKKMIKTHQQNTDQS